MGPMDSALLSSLSSLYVMLADSKFGNIKAFTFLLASFEKGKLDLSISLFRAKSVCNSPSTDKSGWRRCK